MAKDQPNYLSISLIRGETRVIPFVYRPRDTSLPPFDLSGKSIEIRIKPDGLAEISFDSPEIVISDAANGEFTLEIPGATIGSWEFQNAKYAILLDGARLIYGDLIINGLYE